MRKSTVTDLVRHRRELLLVYDARDCNPNGDPDEENRPRTDPETGQNLVTDVRLKRYVRDYLRDHRGYNDDSRRSIYVWGGDPGTGEARITREKRFGTFGSVNTVIERCIDVRLFGATFAVKRDKGKKKDDADVDAGDRGNLFLTGPVQFKLGRSLHAVEVARMAGTSVQPSGEKKAQGTFRDDWMVRYSLIAFYGVINEVSARSTRLTESDVDELLGALWHAIPACDSRSKLGQQPRVLVELTHREEIGGSRYIGSLDHKIAMQLDDGLTEEQVRHLGQYALDLTPLGRAIERIESVERIRGRIDPELRVAGIDAGKLGGVTIEPLPALPTFEVNANE